MGHIGALRQGRNDDNIFPKGMSGKQLFKMPSERFKNSMEKEKEHYSIIADENYIVLVGLLAGKWVWIALKQTKGISY